MDVTGSPVRPVRPDDLTLTMLAQRRVTFLRRNRTFTRATLSRAVSSVLVVPVRPIRSSTGQRWLILPPEPGTRPPWEAHPPAVTDYDHALRVDMLLRWLPPASPETVTSTAMLVERRGPCIVDDGDIAWWQAFGQACAIVGRTAAASLVVCATGIRDISAGRTTDAA